MNENYVKNYDLWNEKKKELNARSLPDDVFFLEREIWWASLGVNVGSEIDGKGKDFLRPILIVRKFNEDLMWAVPITSTCKEMSYFWRIDFGRIRGVASLLQLRLVSINRLFELVARLEEDEFVKIRQMIADLLVKNETTPFKE